MWWILVIIIIAVVVMGSENEGKYKEDKYRSVVRADHTKT